MIDLLQFAICIWVGTKNEYICVCCGNLHLHFAQDEDVCKVNIFPTKIAWYTKMDNLPIHQGPWIINNISILIIVELDKYWIVTL